MRVLIGNPFEMTSNSNLPIRIAVIGADSMVGSRFCEIARDFQLIKASFSDEIQIDITSVQSVEKFYKEQNFEWAILFAAFTDVNAAEEQRDDKMGSCFQINVEGAKNTAYASKKYNRRLIFISTDFVFDGLNSPYSEDDPWGPDFEKVSWYGITKTEAEKSILEILRDAIILRIAYPYRGPFDKKDDIAKRIIRMYKQDDLYPMFADQMISPTFVDDLYGAIRLLISKGQSGIFHLASPTAVSQYEFAKELLSVFGYDTGKIKKGSIVSFLKNSSVPRPKGSALKVSKISKLGFTPTDFRQGIRIVYKQSQGKLI